MQAILLLFRALTAFVMIAVIAVTNFDGFHDLHRDSLLFDGITVWAFIVTVFFLTAFFVTVFFVTVKASRNQSTY